jgi:hypothetical protein
LTFAINVKHHHQNLSANFTYLKVVGPSLKKDNGMKNMRTLSRVLIIGLFTLSGAAQAVTQQLGARGQVQRMIVNSNADNDQIYLTATGAGHLCFSMTLQTNDPNVSATSFKTLYAYLLTAKVMGKTLEFYTDTSCRLFRLEMVD